ncbi:MAG TPA: exonuclease domain-containing protein [Candidatus Dormibacteraeota bacterium]|nr:exonuclease domain-containing protein [Candidatus Dormibacteraeota bacterium]
MREKLHRYLMERPSGATARELLDLIFTRPGADREFGPRFLQALLGADARFAFSAATERWIATAHAALAQPLEAATWVVVDLETTGGAPAGGHGIIEIGALKVAGGQVIDRFAQLVHPGRRLPPFITGLTGITDAMLAEQPRIDAVLPRFVDFAAGAVLVAHNAGFDLGFLDAARLAIAGETFDQPHACTLRLARRLLPQLRRKSLDALGGHFGIPLVDRHRALGDARITVEVLFQLFELARRRGVRRVAELLDLQHSASDGRRFVCALPRARVAALPMAPGIYRFRDADGRLLYVGKAKNLRQRVGSYLTNAAAHRGKVLDLIRHIHDVEVEVAGSELEASLCEADEIRRAKPPYNRLSKHLPQIAFLKLMLNDTYPRLAVVSRLSGRAGRYFGPFRSRLSAVEAQALVARLFRLRTCTGRLEPGPDVSPCLQGQIGACSAPCTARVDRAAYSLQVAAAARFFDGEIGAAQREIERRRESHAAAQRFEAAARAQRDLELVRRMRRRQRAMSWIVERQHFAVMQPAADGARALLYAVAHGRLIARGAATCADELVPFATRVQTELMLPGKRALEAEDVEGTIILAAWLRSRGERDGFVFRLSEEAPVAAQLGEWSTALESIVSRSSAA